jgi:peptidoglycan/LPS O-acetylase OafA/YrhL
VALYQPVALPKVYKTLAILSVLCAAILISQVYTGWWPYVPQRTLHAVIALWLITYILLHGAKRRFPFSFVFNNPILLFLGKISYGIYMYHVLVQWFGFIVSRWVDKYLPYSFVRQYHDYFVMAINFCLLIFIAWLSWICIEKPILKLKSYYDLKMIKAKEARPVTLKTT